LPFQFVYPRRIRILKTEFTALPEIAEAVEKYKFFSARNICEIAFYGAHNNCDCDSRPSIPEHAAEVQIHGIKHDDHQNFNAA
ncbi:hypothetical protein BDZ97DRAFT_1661941, partial [Flammula alnicola]